MDEDDGQIARELVPVDEAFMRQDEDEEGTAATLGLEQKCNTVSKLLHISVEVDEREPLLNYLSKCWGNMQA